MYRYPARGNPHGGRATARRCRPTPRRQSSTGKPPGSGAQTARSCETERVLFCQHRNGHAGAPPVLPMAQHDDSCARQNGGAGSGGKPDKAGADLRVAIRTYRFPVVGKGYKPCIPRFVPIFPLMRARTIGRLVLCDSPQAHLGPAIAGRPWIWVLLIRKRIFSLYIIKWVSLDAYH